MKIRNFINRFMVLLVLVGWIVYFVLLTFFMNNYSRNVVNEFVSSFGSEIDNNIDTMVNDLKLSMSGYGKQDLSSWSKVKDFLARQETVHGTEEVSYRLVDNSGLMVTHNGTVQGVTNAQAIWRGVKGENHYSITSTFDANSDSEKVLICIPFPGNEEYCYAMVMRPEYFARGCFQNMRIQNVQMGIYNQFGVEMSFLDLENATAEETQDAPENNPQGIRSQLQDGANDIAAAVSTGTYVFTSESGQGNAFWEADRVYIALPEPDGWFFGINIPAVQTIPFMPLLISTFALMLATGVALVINSILANGRMLRRSKNSKNLDVLSDFESDELMEQALRRLFQKQQEKDFCIVCLDIAAFHRFNAMFGYAAGDRLLYIIGNALRTHYPACTRLSGDVFAVLTPITPTFIEDLELVLYNSIRTELGTQYQQVIVFKFGVYPIIEMPSNFREIYDGALMAVKEAKGRPKQNVVVYDASFQNQVSFQKDIEINMLHALSKEEFLVYIQPKISVKTRNCSGGEALIRWNSEQMGFIMPDQFIPIFERNGFIMEIDFFVLTTVLKYQQDALDNGRPLHPISVNQSKVTISLPNYLERLQKTVGKFTVPLEYVEIEITEGALESDYETMINLMYSLKEMGFSVAMDDFGTGYSSLNTLRVLPVDVLKIDKGFLRESDTSDRSRKIIKNVINMSKELGISIVCEGVETELQFDFLDAIGCDYVQGYLFAKPMEYEEYEKRYGSVTTFERTEQAAPKAQQIV